VMRFLLMIDRSKRMFSSPWYVELLLWHVNHKDRWKDSTP
jgi:hypothetical protein